MGLFVLPNIWAFKPKKCSKKRIIPIGKLDKCRIFVTVFHRILDFKNGAGFLSWPHFFCHTSSRYPVPLTN